jgi:hypothetical protein
MHGALAQIYGLVEVISVRASVMETKYLDQYAFVWNRQVLAKCMELIAK